MTNYFSLIPQEITLIILQQLSNRTVHLFAQTSRLIATIVNCKFVYPKCYDKFSPSIKNLGDILFPPLTLDFLSMHLDQLLNKHMSFTVDANLMLATIISKQWDFLPVVIRTIMIKHKR